MEALYLKQGEIKNMFNRHCNKKETEALNQFKQGPKLRFSVIHVKSHITNYGQLSMQF